MCPEFLKEPLTPGVAGESYKMKQHREVHEAARLRHFYDIEEKLEATDQNREQILKYMDSICEGSGDKDLEIKKGELKETERESIYYLLHLNIKLPRKEITLKDILTLLAVEYNMWSNQIIQESFAKKSEIADEKERERIDDSRFDLYKLKLCLNGLTNAHGLNVAELKVFARSEIVKAMIAVFKKREGTTSIPRDIALKNITRIEKAIKHLKRPKQANRVVN